MQAVDFEGILNEYFFDADRKITPAHLRSVCQYKKSDKTCRYIGLSVKGFVCVKNTPIKLALDKQVADGLMAAQGDNCEGLGDFKEKKSG